MRFLNVFFEAKKDSDNDGETNIELVLDLSLIRSKKYSRVGLDWETHQLYLKTEDSFDFQWRATPR